MPPHQLFPDLITAILLLLPVKSLLRFRSLSISYRNEIDSSSFVQMHLKRSINTKTHRKLFFFRTIHSLSSYNQTDNISAAYFDDDKLFQFQFKELYKPSIIDTCLGLILLSAQHDSPHRELFLWNPTTRKIKKLPLCFKRKTYVNAGLGYDSTTDDYKVLCIFIDHSNSVNTQNKEYPYSYKVYSLKLNSWKCTQYFDDTTKPVFPIGFANGFLYWKHKGVEIGKIGCFDLANEMYITLPNFYSPHDDDLPAEVNRNIIFGVDVVEGNVMMRIKLNLVFEFYSSMVDTKVGGGGKWSKAFTFKAETWSSINYLEDVIPLAYSKDGSRVLLNVSNGIFWYNIQKKTKHWVQFYGDMYKDYTFKHYVSWESLVSLGNEGVVQV